MITDQLEITLSCSARASPWQNGFMERFFGTLKDELPPLTALKSTEQLLEAVAMTMHYYNHKRRHSALNNMSPAAYAASLPTPRSASMTATPLLKKRDRVRMKVGA